MEGSERLTTVRVGDETGLSKNALKRLRKKAEHESTKKEWRAKIREKRKASRKRRVQDLIEQGSFLSISKF